MKFVFAVVVSFGLALISAVALADVAAGDAAPVKVEKEKKFCRIEQVTGSMFDRRTCHTTAEWKAIDEANAAETKRVQDHRSSNTNGF